MKKRFGFLGIGALAFLVLLSLMLSGAPALADQSPSYSCSIKVPEPEPANLAALAKITAEQAMAAAQAAYPGSKAQKVTLENENGCLVFCVDLSNGLEVKVDAGNGAVLGHEQGDSEEENHEDHKQ
jgi:uncharacterized iron-regulated membrane protein